MRIRKRKGRPRYLVTYVLPLKDWVQVLKETTKPIEEDTALLRGRLCSIDGVTFIQTERKDHERGRENS